MEYTRQSSASLRLRVCTHTILGRPLMYFVSRFSAVSWSKYSWSRSSGKWQYPGPGSCMRSRENRSSFAESTPTGNSFTRPLFRLLGLPKMGCPGFGLPLMAKMRYFSYLLQNRYTASEQWPPVSTQVAEMGISRPQAWVNGVSR